MAAVWSIIFGFLPVWVQVVLLVLIAILLVILVVRVIAGILEAIPFL